MKKYQAAVNEIIETTKKWQIFHNKWGKKQEHHIYLLGFLKIRCYKDGNVYFNVEVSISNVDILQVNITHCGTELIFKDKVLSDIAQITEYSRIFKTSIQKQIESFESKSKGAMARKILLLNEKLQEQKEESAKTEKELKSLDKIF